MKGKSKRNDPERFCGEKTELHFYQFFSYLMTGIFDRLSSCEMTDLFPVKLTIILTWNYFVFVGTNGPKDQNTLRQIFFFFPS